MKTAVSDVFKMTVGTMTSRKHLRLVKDEDEQKEGGEQLFEHTYRTNPILSQILMIAAGLFAIGALAYYSSRESPSYIAAYERMLKHADTDRNGAVSFAEQADAWKRMGYRGPFVELLGASQFPKPKLEEVERALEIYQRQQNSYMRDLR